MTNAILNKSLRTMNMCAAEDQWNWNLRDSPRGYWLDLTRSKEPIKIPHSSTAPNLALLNADIMTIHSLTKRETIKKGGISIRASSRGENVQRSDPWVVKRSPVILVVAPSSLFIPFQCSPLWFWISVIAFSEGVVHSVCVCLVFIRRCHCHSLCRLLGVLRLTQVGLFPLRQLQTPCSFGCITRTNKQTLPLGWTGSRPFSITTTVTTPTTASRRFWRGGDQGGTEEAWENRTLRQSSAQIPIIPGSFLYPLNFNYFQRSSAGQGPVTRPFLCLAHPPYTHIHTHPPKLEAKITKSKTMCDAFRWKCACVWAQRRKGNLDGRHVQSGLLPLAWWLLRKALHKIKCSF